MGLSSIFGGGGDSQKVESKPWEGVRPALKDLYAGTMATGQNQMPMAPFTTYAPFNPLQIGGMQGTLDYTQNRFEPGVGFQQATLQDMMMSPQNVMQNPTLQAMMGANASNIGDTLQRKWLPQITSNAVHGGGMSNSRKNIERGLAFGDAAQALANANAQTLYGAYSDALGQQRAGAQMMPNALSLGFAGPQAAMDIGRMQQGMDQQRIDEMQQRYYYPEQKMRDTLNWQNSIYAGAAPYGERKSQQGGSNTFGNMLGAGLTLGGMLTGLGGMPAMAPIGAVTGSGLSGGLNFGGSSPATMPGFMGAMGF